MSLFDKLGGMFKGSKTGGESNFLSDFNAPGKFYMGGSYNNTVGNTGNYGLPTQTTFGTQPQTKPLGDYSFTKDSKVYIPDTEFGKKIANAEPNKFKNALAGGLEAFSNSEPNMSIPEISLAGFNYQNGQVNPVEQLQGSNLYYYLV